MFSESPCGLAVNLRSEVRTRKIYPSGRTRLEESGWIGIGRTQVGAAPGIGIGIGVMMLGGAAGERLQNPGTPGLWFVSYRVLSEQFGD